MKLYVGGRVGGGEKLGNYKLGQAQPRLGLKASYCGLVVM